MCLKGKAAVVTGSGQGIGRAIAMALAAEGASVVTNSPFVGEEGGDAQTVADDIIKAGGKAVPVFADVSSFEDSKRLIETSVKEFSRIDILINNAGVDTAKMIWNMTEEEWDRTVDITLKGVFNCSRFAAGFMREQKWGRIINTTSSAWIRTVGHVNYGAAKAGVVGLTRSIAMELGKYDVTCNAFTPIASTRMTDNKDVKEGLKKRFKAGHLTKEQLETALNMPPAEGITPLIVFLASERASDISGYVFNIDAGNLGIYSEPKVISSIKKNFKNDGFFSLDEIETFIHQETRPNEE